MRNLMKNEYMKYALMAIGAVTVLVALVIGANMYLTSSSYSIPFLGEGGKSSGSVFDDDSEMKALVKKQIVTALDEGGYVAEEDLESIITDEMLEKILADIREKLDTTIANEVASAVDGSQLSDAEIRQIVLKEVNDYIKNNSDVDEITKIKEQIEALKKADSTLSSKINNGTNGKNGSGQVGQAGAAGKNGKDGTNGKDGRSAADIMGQSEEQFKQSTNETRQNASQAKSDSETAKKNSEDANKTAADAKSTAEQTQKKVDDFLANPQITVTGTTDASGQSKITITKQ